MGFRDLFNQAVDYASESAQSALDYATDGAEAVMDVAEDIYEGASDLGADAYYAAKGLVSDHLTPFQNITVQMYSNLLEDTQAHDPAKDGPINRADQMRKAFLHNPDTYNALMHSAIILDQHEIAFELENEAKTLNDTGWLDNYVSDLASRAQTVADAAYEDGKPISAYSSDLDGLARAPQQNFLDADIKTDAATTLSKSFSGAVSDFSEIVIEDPVQAKTKIAEAEMDSTKIPAVSEFSEIVIENPAQNQTKIAETEKPENELSEQINDGGFISSANAAELPESKAEEKPETKDKVEANPETETAVEKDTDVDVDANAEVGAEAEQDIYAVQSGDTLWGIAKSQYGLSNYKDIMRTVEHIANDNNLEQGVKANHIDVGQKLRMPSAEDAAKPIVPPEQQHLNWQALDRDAGMTLTN